MSGLYHGRIQQANEDFCMPGGVDDEDEFAPKHELDFV